MPDSATGGRFSGGAAADEGGRTRSFGWPRKRTDLGHDPAEGHGRNAETVSDSSKTSAEHVEATPEAKVGLVETVAVRIGPDSVAGRL
jgi:hypothetical protein